jgi:hypothetical protein
MVSSRDNQIEKNPVFYRSFEENSFALEIHYLVKETSARVEICRTI